MSEAEPSPLQDRRFLVLERIGRGGMGEVFRAFDRAEQRLVALKVVEPERRAGPDHPLTAEYEAWVRFDHPNIVRAYELAVARRGPLRRGAPYLVLQHVHGDPASRAVPERGFPDPVVEALARQVLRALGQVHAAGLIHRDLKPANVLIDPRAAASSRYKLTDFGLAAPFGVAGRPGTISGSLPYVAPEALLGRPLDARADLYGLGVLLYHLCTGQLPVPDGGAAAMLRWHVGGEPADPTLLRPGVSPRLARFIRRLTERDPARRPASATEALAALRGRGEPAGTPPPPPVGGRARRAALRLALDAARLGAVRWFRLQGPDAASLLRDVAVWAGARGIDVYRLGDGREKAGVEALEALVLRLLIERVRHPARAVRRFALNRALGIAIVGGLPILDRQGGRARRRLADSRAALGIRDFILDCAGAAALVLVAGPAGGRGLVAEVLAALAGATARSAPGRAGGLLVVTG